MRFCSRVEDPATGRELPGPAVGSSIADEHNQPSQRYSAQVISGDSLTSPTPGLLCLQLHSSHSDRPRTASTPMTKPNLTTVHGFSRYLRQESKTRVKRFTVRQAKPGRREQ
jgi:hypothetical protein